MMSILKNSNFLAVAIVFLLIVSPYYFSYLQSQPSRQIKFWSLVIFALIASLVIYAVCVKLRIRPYAVCMLNRGLFFKRKQD